MPLDLLVCGVRALDPQAFIIENTEYIVDNKDTNYKR